MSAVPGPAYEDAFACCWTFLSEVDSDDLADLTVVARVRLGVVGSSPRYLGTSLVGWFDGIPSIGHWSRGL